MTLREMSKDYRASAQLLRARLHLLRKQLEQNQDPQQAWQLQQRIRMLTPMLTEMNDLAQLTEHYYERGYYRHENYTLQHITGPAVAKGNAAQAHPGRYGQ